jgi:DUF971 family protein
MAETTPWPTEIRLSADKATLHVAFDDGRAFALPAELLRVMSPSAEVQGHSAASRVTVAGKRSVRIARLVAVGNYAVQIIFSDGHSTGYYRWSYLRDLGERESEHWAAYEAELAAKGLSRE